MQELVYGSPTQQFIYIKDEKKIVSLVCPEFAITMPSEDCESVGAFHLSNESHTVDRNKWSFDGKGIIESLKCPQKYITIHGILGRQSRMSSFLSDQLVEVGSLPKKVPENANISSDATSYTNSPSHEQAGYSYKNYTNATEHAETVYSNETCAQTAYENVPHSQKVWDPSKPPSVGSAIILADFDPSRYQKWEQIHQVYDLLCMKFSFPILLMVITFLFCISFSIL